ncbi:MAG: ABC transporter permease [Gammaproteobacteria bacterium]|nr:ABC transporter permease [Gammaproteobacteria bacterium]
MKAFLALLKARNLEFLRDRSALTWNVLFPLLLIMSFAVIFSNDTKLSYKVGVLGSLENLSQNLRETKYLDFVSFDEKEIAIKKVSQHQIDMLLELGEKPHYWINSTSPNGYILERVLKGSGEQQFEKSEVTGKEIRYIDWALPGILAMNIMFSCLFGVGYVIVRYRKNGFLKRLKATPLSAYQFLVAQLVSRLLLIMSITVIVYIGCDIFIDFHMIGSYVLLFFTAILGSICMISLGLLSASRIRSEELAGGILNLATWPMMILSGVWFSLEGAPDVIKLMAQALPLTHFVDATRAIMTEGAGIAEIAPELITLSIMSLIFLLIGSLIFRWN